MKTPPSSPLIAIQHIPPRSRSITSIGDLTTKAATRLFPENPPLIFVENDGLDLDPLTNAFKQAKWTDEEAAKVVSSYADVLNAGREMDVKALARWVLHHSNDSEQVNECISSIPPKEIEIIKVLSRAGSQKVVFLATWRLTQADVVLKKVIASTEATERILSRELRANPLNMVHRNIIETHILRNARDEAFLVEKKLPEVLSDEWSSKGIHEAANLLFDIGKALKFLHDKKLVHGDVKPDNIGKSGDTYVLLDFGICREWSAFAPETTPTGSLRTRAPELLENQIPSDPGKIDVWALGATLFNALKGRFPLIAEDETVPRISKPDKRTEFEEILLRRVRDEWAKWVQFQEVPESMGSILKQMLERDPAKRVSAKDVLDIARQELSAFIRSDSVRGEAIARFSPIEELSQIRQYLEATQEMPKILPTTKRRMLKDRLVELGKTLGSAETSEKQTIGRLCELLA